MKKTKTKKKTPQRAPKSKKKPVPVLSGRELIRKNKEKEWKKIEKRFMNVTNHMTFWNGKVAVDFFKPYFIGA